MTASNSVSGEASVSSAQAPPVKKKRSLPGMPDPNAEVIALSPKSLLATNRFVCEICNKGFQRDQNLQLHRRGHNLPWKLRQRSGKEARKRVYVCPEPGCVHHDPSRALGDLTGIKKHFCRKHGEKNWKCEKCSKKYAVQSDWKAHNKTCGTREYRCDCGTLFSRRDSFVTHRAFCEALAENSRPPPAAAAAADSGVEEESRASPLPALPIQQVPLAPPEAREPENANKLPQWPPQPAPGLSSSSTTTTTSGGSSNSSPATTSQSTSLFASLFPPSAPPAAAAQATPFSNLAGADAAAMEPPLLCLSSFFPVAPERRQSQPSPHMSATALLQKAAQMGTASSSSSFLRSLGLATSSTNNAGGDVAGGPLHWSQQQQRTPFGLGLGLAYDSSGVAAAANLPELMMGPSPLFGPKPATPDFLSLGMSPAFMTSVGGGVGGSLPEKPWEAADTKPDRSTFP